MFTKGRLAGEIVARGRARAAAAWTSNANLGAAKCEFGGVCFACFTANTAKYSPGYFQNLRIRAVFGVPGRRQSTIYVRTA